MDGGEERGGGRVVERERGGGDFEEEDGEGGEGRGVEEGGGERFHGGLKEVGEFLEHRHLVDEVVDEGDIRFGGETDTGVERVGVLLLVFSEVHVRLRRR